MNKEIENQIASVIESALNLGGESKVFLYEQIPDLVNQLLMWNIINGIMKTGSLRGNNTLPFRAGIHGPLKLK